MLLIQCYTGGRAIRYYTDRETERDRGRQREIEGDRERQRETERDRGRQREIEGDRESQKEIAKDRKREF